MLCTVRLTPSQLLICAKALVYIAVFRCYLAAGPKALNISKVLFIRWASAKEFSSKLWPKQGMNKNDYGNDENACAMKMKRSNNTRQSNVDNKSEAN